MTTTGRTCGQPTTGTARCTHPVGPLGRCSAGHRCGPTATSVTKAVSQPAIPDPFGQSDPTGHAPDPTSDLAMNIAYAVDRLSEVIDDDGFGVGTEAEIDAAAQWALPRVGWALDAADGHLAPPPATGATDRYYTPHRHVSHAYAHLRRAGETTDAVALRGELAAARDRLTAARIDVYASMTAERVVAEPSFQIPWDSPEEHRTELARHLGRDARDDDVARSHQRTHDLIDALRNPF